MRSRELVRTDVLMVMTSCLCVRLHTDVDLCSLFFEFSITPSERRRYHDPFRLSLKTPKGVDTSCRLLVKTQYCMSHDNVSIPSPSSLMCFPSNSPSDPITLYFFIHFPYPP